MKEHEFTYEKLTLHVTTSVGVAARPTGGIITGRQLLDLADKALYHAKSQGRNQVVAI